MAKPGIASKPDHHSPQIVPSPASIAPGELDVLKVEVACYIAEMSGEMSRMARASGFHLLSYFLDMAAAEAKTASDGGQKDQRTRSAG